MPKIRRNGTSAFTLVQLLIIITVVVVLAGVAAPRLLRQQEKARRTQATNDIDALGLALDIYANHNGTYPSTEQGLKALWEKPIIPPVPSNWQGPYLDKPILEDPWEKGSVAVYILDGRWDPVRFEASDPEGGGVVVDFEKLELNVDIPDERFVPNTEGYTEISNEQLTTVLMMQLMAVMMQQEHQE